ncbi:hypothetical protein EJ08DRAFT_70833 [Tothia fuscella]|uniref:Uncharacterized protein n=1 Tax=Tothia fuscella TaxID=1048955 RepID=A0A9P4TSV4_9PEZI|nr:hypothetical protein EJ08DRAFT_70833 [Tothia fuscella]
MSILLDRKMASTLQSLPNELKQKIIAKIDKSPEHESDELLTEGVRDVLNLRLVSHDLRDNSAFAFEALFAEITIHLHPRSFVLLVAIASHDKLQKAVRNLFITTNYFAEFHLLNYAHNEQFDIKERPELSATHNELIAEQEAFWESGESIPKLAQALIALENCRGCWDH